MRLVSVRDEPPAPPDVDALRDAVAIDDVECVVVFGSSARDEVGPPSDLDVAVTFEPDVEPFRRKTAW